MRTMRMSEAIQQCCIEGERELLKDVLAHSRPALRPAPPRWMCSRCARPPAAGGAARARSNTTYYNDKIQSYGYICIFIVYRFLHFLKFWCDHWPLTPRASQDRTVKGSTLDPGPCGLRQYLSTTEFYKNVYWIERYKTVLHYEYCGKIGYSKILQHYTKPIVFTDAFYCITGCSKNLLSTKLIHTIEQ